MKIKVYDGTGKKTEKTVETKIFDGKENSVLVSEALYIMSSSRRQGGAKTLDRSEVRGGGAKPWRQKGTGRARAGSSRSPIWRGGGVTFGPTGKENFKLSIPKKKKKAALSAALATKKTEDVIILNSPKLEKPSTKKMVVILSKIGIRRNILILSGEKNEMVEKSVRNVEGVKYRDIRAMNIYDVIWSDKILFLGDSIKKMEKKNG